MRMGRGSKRAISSTMTEPRRHFKFTKRNQWLLSTTSHILGSSWRFSETLPTIVASFLFCMLTTWHGTAARQWFLYAMALLFSGLLCTFIQLMNKSLGSESIMLFIIPSNPFYLLRKWDLRGFTKWSKIPQILGGRMRFKISSRQL